MRKTKILPLLAVFALCLSLIGTAFAARATDFPDYDPAAWYAEAVEAAVKNGLLMGDDRGRLLPNGSLTRAEMAAIVNRAFGTYVEADVSRYTDVSPTAWYYSDVRMAVQMGTYNGTGTATMSPNSPITRQEVMTVVARALQLDTAGYEGTSLSRFGDAGAVSAWALPSVKAMVGAGYIHGNEKQQLAPKDNITRAEFAQIFHNIIREYITAPGVYTGDRTGNLLVRAAGVTLQDLTVNGDLIIGCGAGDGAVTLDNVRITGRLVVWGGGVDAVWMNNGADVDSLTVCRVDGPVKVIFDKDSTLTVRDKIQVTVTDRAAAYPDTEVVFYGEGGLQEVIDQLNALVAAGEIHVSMDSDILALVGQTEVPCQVDNNSVGDVYQVTVTRSDTGEQIAVPLTLGPGQGRDRLTLCAPLPLGDYPCTAKVSRMADGVETGSVELSVTVHVAWLWATKEGL